MQWLVTNWVTIPHCSDISWEPATPLRTATSSQVYTRSDMLDHSPKHRDKAYMYIIVYLFV
jgi:hypothetical protein